MWFLRFIFLFVILLGQLWPMQLSVADAGPQFCKMACCAWQTDAEEGGCHCVETQQTPGQPSPALPFSGTRSDHLPVLTWSDEGEIGVDLLERSRPLLALLPQGDVLGQAAIAHVRLPVLFCAYLM